MSLGPGLIKKGEAMLKRLACLTVIIVLAICFNVSGLFAENSKEEAKAKLSDLRQKKGEMMNEYKMNLHKIDKEAEDKTSALKVDFRKAREECLSDKHNRSEKLRKDFESKLKPMLKEENELVELVGRDAREDFVKTKAERNK